jgi:hypothetical protein
MESRVIGLRGKLPPDSDRGESAKQNSLFLFDQPHAPGPNHSSIRQYCQSCKKTAINRTDSTAGCKFKATALARFSQLLGGFALSEPRLEGVRPLSKADIDLCVVA